MGFTTEPLSPSTVFICAGFYCKFQPKMIYGIIVMFLGTAAIIVSLWDRFAEPDYRSIRAGTFSLLLTISSNAN